MATRWIRWNTTTHIFEFSTDGVVFNVLPLSATILNEGTLADARLSSNVPLKNAANIFTALNRISATAPGLEFNESDRGADLKNWDINIEAEVFKVRTLTDAFAFVADLITLTRAGALFVKDSVDVGPSLQTNSKIRVRAVGNNLEFGHSNTAGYVSTLGCETGSGHPFAGFNTEHGTNVNTYKTRGNVGAIIKSNNAGALSIHTIDGANADNQAPTLRFTFGATGNFSATGTLTERGRTTPVGEWINVAHASGDYTASAGTWTVEAGDVSVFRYMLIGKTLFFDIRLLTTTTSAGMGSQLKIKVPGGFTVLGTSVGVGHWNLNGTYEVGLWTAQSTDIILFRTNFTTNWTSSLTNTLDVRLQGFFAIV